MKQLYLVRHAKAEPPANTVDDHARALTQKGQNAATLIGHYMKKHTLIPEIVLASDAKRTRQTTEHLLQALNIAPPTTFTKTLYTATTRQYLHHIHGQPHPKKALCIVGHNPTIHELALQLCKEHDTSSYLKLLHGFPTGSLACLSFNTDRWQDIAPYQGILETFISPREALAENVS